MNYEERVKAITQAPLSQLPALLSHALLECIKRPVFVDRHAMLRTLTKAMRTKIYDGKEGGYLCICLDCEQEFFGDKRDICCALCAEEPNTKEP